jgi:hypothetical protein
MSNSEQDKPSFEDAWRQAFEGAELKPSDRVWAGVSDRLMETKRRKSRQRFIYYSVAASVLLLLTFGVGWWTISHSGPDQVAITQEERNAPGKSNVTASEEASSSVAKNHQHQSPEPANPTLSQTTQPADPAISADHSGEQRMASGNLSPTEGESLVAHANQGIDQTQTTNKPRSATRPTDSSDSDRLANVRKTRPSANPGDRPVVSSGKNRGKEKKPFNNEPLFQSNENASRIAQELKNADSALPFHSENTGKENGHAPQSEETLAYASVIEPLSVAGIENDAEIIRLSDEQLLRQAPVALLFSQPDQEKAPTKKAPLWISSTFMPNYFSSNVQTLYQPAAVLNGAAFNSRSLTNVQQQGDVNRPNFSYTLGVNAGKDLGSRLSIEGGVQYIYNNASIQTHAYVENTATLEKYPIIADLLSETNNTPESPVYKANMDYSAPLNSALPTQLNPTSTPIELRNEYQYVGFPVKLGYQLNRQEKLRFVVSAGLSTDLFLRNTISGTQSNVYKTEITAGKESAYRTINFSGLLGIGIHYRYASRLSLMLEPTYRSAFFSTTKTTSNVRTMPSNIGVGLGMKFHF